MRQFGRKTRKKKGIAKLRRVNAKEVKSGRIIRKHKDNAAIYIYILTDSKFDRMAIEMKNTRVKRKMCSSLTNFWCVCDVCVFVNLYVECLRCVYL